MTTHQTKKSAIRTWALVAVAVTSAALVTLSFWLVWILSAQSWCTQVLGAAKYADGPPEFAVGGCYKMMMAQIQALSLNSHIAIGIIGLCLLVLVVIVMAGGTLQFTASRNGVSAGIAPTGAPGDPVHVKEEGQ